MKLMTTRSCLVNRSMRFFTGLEELVREQTEVSREELVTDETRERDLNQL